MPATSLQQKWTMTLLLLSFFTMAQTPISIGTQIELFDPLIDQNRTLQIYLPPSYGQSDMQDQHYAVLYLLDSETNFIHTVGTVERLSKFPYPTIPEIIVVGIVNNNRNRDLTPVARKQEIQEQLLLPPFAYKSGGNSGFFDFIVHQLQPYITSNYRTNGYNILLGHSFGAITALNFLYHHPEKMQGFIAQDPSIWWEDAFMLQQYKTLENNSAIFKDKKLFIGQVGPEQNKGSLQDHYRYIQDFSTYICQNQGETLAYNYSQYPGEDHGSIVLKANVDALRYIFEGYYIDFKQIPENPIVVQQQFKDFNERIKFNFKPSKAYLNYLVKHFSHKQNTELTQYFTALLNDIYPKQQSVTRDLKNTQK